MLTRRTATALLAGAATAPSMAWGAKPQGGAVFYDAVGPTLTCWQPDIGNATLMRQGSVTVPALIQYAWRQDRWRWQADVRQGVRHRDERHDAVVERVRSAVAYRSRSGVGITASTYCGYPSRR